MVRILALFLAVAAPAAAQSGARNADVVEVGRSNWERPWLPDFRKPGRKVSIPSDRRIDIVILGDGYLARERKDFERDLRAWYARFLTYTPWKELRGAFRVRGLWTPSGGRATPGKRSHYRLPSTSSSVGKVSSAETRRAIFDSLDRIGANPAAVRTYLTHTTVMLLVRNELGRNPSGLTRTLVSSDGKRRARVGFAAYSHHEFGHAYGGLRDEYIRGVDSRTEQRPRERLSIFTVSNIGYARDLKRLPWAHLAPGSPANPDRGSVVGVLWLGGVAEHGAWHSEGTCLMNGRHENWDLARTRRGVSLRDRDRFCFWCEEILVARTLHKAGILGTSSDGESVWRTWASEFRPFYHKLFDVPGRIRTRNARNARARFPEAKIFERPQ